MYRVVPSPPPLLPPLQPSMLSNQGTSVLSATLQPSVSTAPAIQKTTKDFSTTFLVDMNTQLIYTKLCSLPGQKTLLNR